MKNNVMPAGRQGFTLIEMILYGGILSVFITVLTGIFTSVLDVQLESEASSAVALDSRYIFSRLSYDIGRAASIDIPAALGEQSGSLVLTIGGQTYTYAVAEGNLELTDTTGTNRLNSESTTVSGVTFRKYGNLGGKPSVKAAFTLTSVVVRHGIREQRSYQTTIALR